MGRGVATFAAAVLTAGCYTGASSSADADAGSDAGSVTAGDASSDASDDDGTADDPQAGCAAPPRRIALLSNRRYGHAVRDLLGLASAPEPSNGGGTHDVLVPTSAGKVSGALAFEYHDIAAQAADEALADLATLAPCGEGDDELACASAFVDDFGARAFRRPLTDDERGGLLAVFEVGREQDDSYAGGIRLVVVTMLQSPTFLYLVELGEGDDGNYTLTPYEVASQLAFLLLDSIPDAELRAAAADGRLSTDAGIAAEVDRLLGTEAGRANVTDIVLRWVGSERVLEVQKADATFDDALRESMRLETEHFVDDLLWSGDASLDALLTSRDTFVDARLAGLYGVEAPAGEGFVPVTLPADQRAGVLTHASVLASRSGLDDTSVVYRGLFVANELLCLDFPAPPPGATEAGLDDSVGQRARSEHRMSTAPCSGCHRGFDPYGLLFEHYDELGRYRTTIDDVPVDASAQIEKPESLAGTVQTLVELAPQLAASEDVAACATQRVATYAVQRQQPPDLQCHVDALAPAFAASGESLVELVRLVATSQVVRARGEAEAEDP
ncbi:MAG: DUF1592 domain-containing protein [Deltaproteobacteria bacterium]|nr:DUF1592 domain-containing protein [Nannocystaceae bacterium]